MIVRLTSPERIVPLAVLARAEGFAFLDRLLTEWEDGTNRFEARGEALFGAEIDGALVGLAGLTRQSATLGRVRRVYVRPDVRSRGIATALVGAVLAEARVAYRGIVLFTDTAPAARLYEGLGFERGGVVGPWPATHRLAFVPGVDFEGTDGPREDTGREI